MDVEQSPVRCDECGSTYVAVASRMARLCPECAHRLYGYPPCPHAFEDGRCTRCGWNGVRSTYIEALARRSTEANGGLLDGIAEGLATLEGGWIRRRDWRGALTADVELVAVSFLARDKGIEWCKSERPRGRPSTVRLHLGEHDREGKDVQVVFSIGTGAVGSRTTVGSKSYRPDFIYTGACRLGTVTPFCRIAGAPAVSLSLLLLPVTAVRADRNGLWHLEPKLMTKITDERLLNLLGHGRNGTWDQAG